MQLPHPPSRGPITREMPHWKPRAVVLVFVLLILAGIGVWSAFQDWPEGNPAAAWLRRLREPGRPARGHRPARPAPSTDDPSTATASTAPADAPPDSTGPPEPGTGTCDLAGLVTDEERHPVGKATITLRPNGAGLDRTWETGDDGRFRTGSVPEGVYDVLASHPDYVTLIRPNLAMRRSDASPQIEFRLPLGATARGLVTDEEGAPLADVRVAARRQALGQLAGGETYLDNSTYKLRRTDTAGTFTLEGVALGANVFEFLKRGYQLETTVLEVAPGRPADLGRVVLRRTGSITGLVVDEESRPLPGTSVTLTRYRAPGAEARPPAGDRVTTVTAANGLFAFNRLFNEGGYDLVAENPGYATGYYPGVPAGTEGMICKLDRGGEISGRVEFIDRPTTAVSMALVAEAVVKGTTVTRETASDGAGAFRFTRLPFARYRVTAAGDRYVTEERKPVAVEKGKPATEVKVEVYEACLARGRVQEIDTQKPIAQAAVTVRAAYGPAQARTRTFTATTGPLGDFEFPRLPAGLHSAQATAPGFARASSGASAQTFTLLPGEKKTDITLNLDQGGTVEGYVRTPNRSAVDAAEVQLFPATQAWGAVDTRNLKTKTDANGRFRIGGIEYGERLQLYASASKPGLAKARSPMIDLTVNKRSAAVDITMSPGGGIGGTVTDANSIPITGAEVRFTSREFPGDPTPSVVVTYTRADGVYAINNATPGRGRVRVSRSGFVEKTRTVTVGDGQWLAPVDFRLTGGLAISGRLTSLEGEPIANASMEAKPFRGVEGRDTDSTDRDGKYELTNLGRGLFQVHASFKLPTPDGTQDYLFVLPAVPAGTAAADLDCDVDCHLAGMVRDEDDTGVPSFTVSLRSLDMGWNTQNFRFNLTRTFDGARGFFRILRVPRGFYSLRVVAEGREVYQDDNLLVGPNNRTELRDIRLRGAGGVTGELLSAGTARPVNNATVRLMDEDIASPEAKRLGLSARSDYSGRFRVGMVAAGSYTMEVTHPNYLSYTLTGVRVSRRRPTDVGTIRLEAGGSISGHVEDEDGMPVPDIQVRARGQDAAKDTKTDAAGNYLLQGLRPGPVAVVLDGTYEGLRVYQYQSARVQPDETQEVNFVVDSAATVDGVADAPAGVPTGTVTFRPFDENGAVLADIRFSATISGGRFRVPALPTGRYLLTATGTAAGARWVHWREVYLGRGDNPMRIGLPASLLRGRAVNAAGAPAKGITVELHPIITNIRMAAGVYDPLVLRTTSAADGSFAFRHMQQGPWQVVYRDPAAGMVAHPPLFISPGQVTTDYMVQLSK